MKLKGFICPEFRIDEVELEFKDLIQLFEEFRRTLDRQSREYKENHP